jgi:hypothetical protein
MGLVWLVFFFKPALLIKWFWPLVLYSAGLVTLVSIKPAWLIKRFQPLVLYVSVALGLILASLIFFFAQAPIFPGCWILIIIILLLWLILLMCVHHRAETLAEESLDSRLRDFGEQTGVRKNDQPST